MPERVQLQESHNPRGTHQAAMQIIQACQQKAALQTAAPLARSAQPQAALPSEQSAVVPNKPVMR